MSAILPPESSRRDLEVIGLVGLAHGTSHFFHLLLPPLFPWLMKDFGLSYTQAGFLMTVFFVISAIGQALAGFVVDKVGARPVLFFGVATLSISGLVLAFANSYSMLVMTAALAGLGNSIFHPADFTLLNRRVSIPRLGHAFSVHGLSGNLGWAFAPVALAGIAALTDWHWAGVFATLLGCSVLALLWWRRDVLDDVAQEVVPENLTLTKTGKPQEAGSLGFLRVGAVWLCFAFFFFITMAFGILQSYGPALMKEIYGLNLALATSSLTAFLLGGAAGMLTGGFMAARQQHDNDKVVTKALGLSVIMALLLASAWIPAWSVLPVLTIMGFFTGIAGPHRDLLVRRAATSRFGKASFGRIYGFVYSGLDAGLAISPLIFGPWMDQGRFMTVLLGVALLQAAAILTALGIGQSSSDPSPQ